MPRPVKCRKVCYFPNILEFLPADNTEKKTPIVLTVDEYETIRLLDKKGYSQEQCAASMQVARTTVQRIYEIARKKIADALIDGHPLRIEGGDFIICDGQSSNCSFGGCYKQEIYQKYAAEINLGLDVVRRREDGYHEVRMIMQTIHLYDLLEIQKIREPEIQIVSNLSFLPVNENNLVYKAARLLQEEFALTDGISVKLTKRIPVAAGMAGGSTDAAAMLYAMNQLYDLGLSRRELMKRGVQIGADVPYCLMRGTALAEGIGEKLTQLPPMIKCPVLIAKPSISVSTKFVYQNLKLDEQTNHPDIDALMKDIREKDFDGVCAHMGNVLESVTIPNYPVIAEIKQQMMRSGAKASMMSGSGPTVFGLFEDGETAKRALREMKRSGLAKQVYLTTIYNNRRK